MKGSTQKIEEAKSKAETIIQRSRHGVSVRSIQRAMHINPEEEQDRHAVWRLCSALALLVHDRFIYWECYGGDLLYYPN